MNTVELSSLPSVYSDNFDQALFEAAFDQTMAATAVERLWMNQADLRPFEDDAAIMTAAEAGQLQRISCGLGYMVIQRLREWTPERSEPGHVYHYSPPYLQAEAAAVLDRLGSFWATQFELSDVYALAITSLVRSKLYQANISRQPRKLTVPPESGNSSHLYAYAFDIDGCGLFLRKGGAHEVINPRMTEAYGQHLSAVQQSRQALQDGLDVLKTEGTINYIEEFANTQEHCFHVCVRPPASSSSTNLRTASKLVSDSVEGTL